MTEPTGRGYGAVLRLPGMRAVYLSHSISFAGTVAAEVALSILVFQRSGSPLLSALVLVVSFLPWGLGGTLLSSVADRFPARPLLVVCDLTSATCIAAMLIPHVPVLGLLGLLLLTGFVAPIFQGARAASLAHLLTPELFPVGRSLLRSISQTMVLTGFASGSLVVAAVGPKWLLGADAVSFVVSAAFIRFGTTPTPASGRDPDATSTLLHESMAGLRYVFGQPVLRRLILLGWAVPAFAATADGLAVAYSSQVGSKATSAGALFTGLAGGMVLGELVVSRQSPETRRRLLAPLAILTQLPMLAFVFAPSLVFAALLLALVGFGSSCNQGLDPLVLGATDPAYRGRMFTIQGSGLMTVQGIGIGIAGAIGTVVAARYVISAAGLLGAVVIGGLLARVLRDQVTPTPDLSPAMASPSR